VISSIFLLEAKEPLQPVDLTEVLMVALPMPVEAEVLLM
jgi:hypothetical protein